MKAENLMNDNAVIRDQAFLEKMMTMNEEIEECETVVDLKKKKEEINREVDGLVAAMTKLFAAGKYPEIAEELVKVRFCRRAIEQIEKKEAAMI